MSSENWAAAAEPYLIPAADGQADAWQREASQQGHLGAQQLGAVEEVPAPAEVATSLGLTPGDPVVLRQRVIYLDGTAVELTDSYYLPSIARGTALAEPRKIRGGAVSLLASLGYVGRLRHESVTVRQATTQEREALALTEAQPVLSIHRVVVGDGNLPIEVTVMTMPALGRTLHYTAKIG